MSADLTAGSLTGVVDLALGTNHTCALLADHAIKCWGANALFQAGVNVVGNASRPSVTYPSTVDTSMLPTPPVALAAGDNHTCARTAGGQVWCWGDNTQFQLGHKTMAASVAAPILADTITNADQLAAGGQTTCAHTTDDKVLCWGNDTAGQLGTGVMTSNPLKMFTINNVAGTAELSVGNQHVCARTAAGALTCWGANDAGQLTGAFGVGITPTAVTGLPTVTSVSAGYRHTCAVLADKTVRCWGSDRAGQLGDGQAEVTAPVAPRLECPK
jgi:alpha-tubulin suppressor-like RCC1 family protein